MAAAHCILERVWGGDCPSILYSLSGLDRRLFLQWTCDLQPYIADAPPWQASSVRISSALFDGAGQLIMLILLADQGDSGSL